MVSARAEKIPEMFINVAKELGTEKWLAVVTDNAVVRYCFNDFKIVLARKSEEPPNWKTYYDNRVATIHKNVKMGDGSHIISKQKPADVLLRGCDTNSWIKLKLQWNGPAVYMGNYREAIPTSICKWMYSPRIEHVLRFLPSISQRKKYVITEYKVLLAGSLASRLLYSNSRNKNLIFTSWLVIRPKM